MRFFRRIPTSFAALFLGGGLLCEAIQKRKADKYAHQHIRPYNPDFNPYHPGDTPEEQKAIDQRKREGMEALAGTQEELQRIIKELGNQYRT